MTMSALSASVGRNGANRPGDVRLVQHLLNDAIARVTGALLAVDGVAGPKTTAAIEHFQRQRGLQSDARADPDGPTLQRLLNEHLSALAAGIVQVRMAPGDTVQARQGGDLLAPAFAEYLTRLRG